MTEGKASDAQRRATKKWEKNNPERVKYLRNRTAARTFVRHYADEEDLKELIDIFWDENPNAKKRRGKAPLLCVVTKMSQIIYIYILMLS